MNIPPEFSELCLAFHQDSFEIEGSLQSIIEGALCNVTLEKKKELGRFLAYCLYQCSPAQLMELWNGQDTDIYIRSPSGAVRFWKDVAEAVRSAAEGG